MAKGTYTVDENVRPSKDGSFRSCICTMLVFLVLCVVLLLVSLPWKNQNNNKPILKEKDVEQISIDQNNNQNAKQIAEKDTEDIETGFTTSNYNKIKTTPEKTTSVDNNPKVTNIQSQSFSTTTTTTTTTTEHVFNNHSKTESFALVQTTERITPETIPPQTTQLLETSSIYRSTTADGTASTHRVSSREIEDVTASSTGIEQDQFTSAIDYSTTEVDTTSVAPSTTYLPIALKPNSTSTLESTSTSTINKHYVKTTNKIMEPHSTSTTDSTIRTTSTEAISEEDFEINETSGTGFTDYPDLHHVKQQETSSATLAAVISTTISTNTQPPSSEKSTSTTAISMPKKSTKSILNSQPLLSLLKPQQSVCQSSDCKMVATRILSRINHMADPCEDFYDYACGAADDYNGHIANWRWIAEKVHEVTGASPVNRQIFRKYFDSCVTFHSDFNYEQRIKGAKDILLGVSQLYDRTQQIPKEMTLTELLTRLLLHDSTPLFDISVDVDQQSKHFIFKLTLGKQSTLLEEENAMSRSQQKCFRQLKRRFNKGTVDLNSMYEKFTLCQNNHSDYINSVEKAVKTFGAFSNLDEYNITWHIQNILKTIEWDVLAKLEDLPPASSVHNDIITKKYLVVKVSELQLHFKLIKWDVLLSRLVRKPINEEQTVQVYFVGYFKKLFEQLEALPSWQLHNALFAMFANDLYRSLVVPQATQNIEDFCLRQSGRLLKEVTSSISLTSFAATDLAFAQTQLNQTFTQLTKYISALVRETEWLDDASRVSMLVKLNKMAIVGLDTLEIWQNDTFIDTRMTHLSNTDEDYQMLSIALLRHNRETLYNLWGEYALQPQSIWWFFTTPFDSKSISVYSLNTIVVPPAVILNIPKNIPRYITLATLGYSLAKQIASQFDTTGIKYDMKLSDEASISYKAMETCGIDKYSLASSQFVNGKLFSFKLNASLSINERLLEDMAVKLITDMSREVINDTLLPWISDSYSREKIFYLVIAQEHCVRTTWEEYFIELFESEQLPSSFLLKGLLANLISFAETFECAAGSGMNHPMKCPVLPDLPKEDDYYADNVRDLK